MPATKRTLKELRDSLKTLQTTARKQGLTYARNTEPEEWAYFRGKEDGVAAARKLVEQLCQ